MDRALLVELEPEAARLYDRHAKVAQEWFPHDFIPYRLGRDFDKEPWTPDQPRLTGVAQTAFEIGLLTEDNLPSYHRLIHGMFGKGDGAWINWVGRWTAEEGRHAIVLRDYLTVTRNIDPVLLERGRMTQLQQGYDHDAPSTLRGLAYVAFQELATRIAHRNTGRYSDDPVADKIMVRIAADENLHMVFYRDILGAALKVQPSAAVRAIVDEVLAFEMPGAGIPGFLRKAAQIAKAGIYDLRVHRDEVLLPIIRHWGIFELEGLDAAAEDARRRLAAHLDELDAAARRFEEKVGALRLPAARAEPLDRPAEQADHELDEADGQPGRQPDDAEQQEARGPRRTPGDRPSLASGSRAWRRKMARFARVRARHDVEDVADERDEPDGQVDDEVDDHPGQGPARDAEAGRLEDDPAADDRRGHVADDRDQPDERVEPEALLRARDGHEVVEQVGDAMDPGLGRVEPFRAAAARRSPRRWTGLRIARV